MPPCSCWPFSCRPSSSAAARSWARIRTSWPLSSPASACARARKRGGTFALIASRLVRRLSGIDQGSVCLLVLTVLPVLGSILCRAVLANRFLPSLLVCFVTLAVEQGLILLMKHFFAGVAWEQAGRALRCLLVTLPVQPAVYGLVKCIAKIGEYHEST